jgi:hypothetical protein
MTNKNLTIIIAHFDFSNSKIRNEGLKKCIASINEKVPIVLIRYVDFKKRTNFKRSNITCVDVSEAGVLWQRERFWNMALNYISEGCENVAWIDSDICFTDDEWIEKLTIELTSKNLVHLFDHVVDKDLNLTNDDENEFSRKSILSVLNGCSNQMSDYFGKSGISLNWGCSPGFAWATKTKIIKKCLFPDFLILGSGDKALLSAAMGLHETYVKALKLNSYMTDKYLTWAELFFIEIKGEIGYLENTINHIAQGEYEKRQYSDRYSIIIDESFEFDKFLKKSMSGSWIWKSNNVFKDKIYEYFQLRED